MTDQESFRSRSKAVRNSARLHLLAIRQERIAKRGLRFDQRPTGSDLDVITMDTAVTNAPLHPEVGPRGAESAAAKPTIDERSVVKDSSPPTETEQAGSAGQTAPHGSNAIDEQPNRTKFAEDALNEDLAVQRTALAELSDDPGQFNVNSVEANVATNAVSLELSRSSNRDSATAAVDQTNTDPLVNDDASQHFALTEPFDDNHAEPSTRNGSPSSTHFTTEGHSTTKEPIEHGEEDRGSGLLAAASLQASSDQFAESEPQQVRSLGLIIDPSTPAPAARAALSELCDLPGAGPGLIWILEQCGIKTMADLATSEVAILTPKLGLVGQILDVGVWLAFARQHVASRELPLERADFATDTHSQTPLAG